MTSTDHDYYTSCDNGDCGGTCWYCTLSICKVCGLYEGSLTTHCPGKRVGGDTSDQIYSGKLDFRNGEWVEKHSPMMQSVIQGQIFDMLRDKTDMTHAKIRIKYGISKDDYNQILSTCIKSLIEGR